jgi:excisionase family DNA binding protein
MHRIFLFEISLDELVEKTAQRVAEKLRNVLPEGEKSEEYLTSQQTAKRLQISLPTLNKYSKQGIIPSSRIGRNIRYRLTDIDKFIDTSIRFKIKGGINET